MCDALARTRDAGWWDMHGGEGVRARLSTLGVHALQASVTVCSRRRYAWALATCFLARGRETARLSCTRELVPRRAGALAARGV